MIATFYNHFCMKLDKIPQMKHFISECVYMPESF